MMSTRRPGPTSIRRQERAGLTRGRGWDTVAMRTSLTWGLPGPGVLPTPPGPLLAPGPCCPDTLILRLSTLYVNRRATVLPKLPGNRLPGGGKAFASVDVVCLPT